MADAPAEWPSCSSSAVTPSPDLPRTITPVPAVRSSSTPGGYRTGPPRADEMHAQTSGDPERRAASARIITYDCTARPVPGMLHRPLSESMITRHSCREITAAVLASASIASEARTCRRVVPGCWRAAPIPTYPLYIRSKSR